MARQALVIGLGQFGMALSRSLAEGGVEVIASDLREDRVRIASNFVAEAVAFDGTDEEALARTAPARRDLCICAFGDESRQASILTTALLRQMGAKRVVARATDPLQERILRLVGAHDVVNPEKAFGERYATRLLYENVLEALPLGDDLVITELATPRALAGRPLAELELPRRFSVTVVAIRRAGAAGVALPQAGDRLEADDVIIVVSQRDAVPRMLEKVGR
jgi:trk system potassium uptake protein TrkA